MKDRPAISVAIDEVLRDEAAPLFKQHGFRKRGRAWRRGTSECTCAVSAQSSDANHDTWGRFTLNLGFAYSALGEVAPESWQGYAFPHYERSHGVIAAYDIGRVVPASGWWQFDDARDSDERELVGEQLAAALRLHVVPFVNACNDPRAFRDHRLAGSGNYLLEAARMSALLGDQAERALAIDGWLEFCREPDRATWPDAWHYIQVLPDLEALGRKLSGIDAQLAERAIQLAMEDAHNNQLPGGVNERGLSELAHHLGLPMTTSRDDTDQH